MFNADIPTRAELPTTAQLIKSTVLALVAAVAILVTLVLPAEYAIDPTGIGRMLGLAHMGEIKRQLAAEAEADRQRDREQQQMVPHQQSPDRRSGFVGTVIARLLIPPAAAADRSLAQAPVRTDETVVTL